MAMVLGLTEGRRSVAVMSRRTKTLAAAIAAIFIVFVAGPWIYINVIREPAAESFLVEVVSTTVADTDGAPATTTGEMGTATVAGITDPDGRWRVSADSQVGYRVDEVLFGQNVTAVGRTNAVSGFVTIDSSTVTAAEFSVDMTTVQSDEPKRDAQFASRIMDVLNYPTSTFVLESPFAVTEAALVSTATHQARGMLTLRGASKSVEVTVISTVRDGRVSVVGEIPIVFAEWGIPNPSIPGISTEDAGVLEFNLVLER